MPVKLRLNSLSGASLSDRQKPRNDYRPDWRISEICKDKASVERLISYKNSKMADDRLASVAMKNP